MEEGKEEERNEGMKQGGREGGAYFLYRPVRYQHSNMICSTSLEYPLDACEKRK